MAVSYKKLLHMMIERDISNAQLMKDACISANIISKLKSGQYIALDKVESICTAMGCTPNDMLEFVPNLQLAKKTPECLEYVIVHELMHLVEKSHNEKFVALMDKYLPNWREIQKSLNGQILDYMDVKPLNLL